jgi:polyhydroxyalkanoate synthesis regulator phasin
MSSDEKKWVQAYEKFAAQTKEFFEESRDKTVSSLEHAMERAREQLVKAGDLTQEESREIKAYLRRDLEQTAADLRKAGDSARKTASPSAIQAGFLDLTQSIAEGARSMFDRLAEWADTTATYHTGEVAAQGTFRCRNCESELHFSETGRIPPCPKCHGTQYRRVE